MTLTGLAFLISFAYGMLSALGRHPDLRTDHLHRGVVFAPAVSLVGSQFARWAMGVSCVFSHIFRLSIALLTADETDQNSNRTAFFMALSILFVWMVIQWPWALWTAEARGNC